MGEDSFKYVFHRGEKLVLKGVSSGGIIAQNNPAFLIEHDDQGVFYFHNFISVGNRAMHRFIQSNQDGGVQVYSLRDLGIREIVDNSVFTEPGFGYGISVLGEDSEKYQEALALLGGKVE